MGGRQLENFNEWHREWEESGRVWDFEHEIVAYCESDCNILWMAVSVFRKRAIEQFVIDPIFSALTQSKFSMMIYTLRFMPLDTIALIPDGTRVAWLREKQSQECLKWLTWVEQVTGYRIHHAGNSVLEAKISGMAVDGYQKETARVYEYNGSCARRVFEINPI
jgi:hypothetical protein